MPYHPCPDMVEPPQAPEDSPAMVEGAATVARGERQEAVLQRLAELGMKMAEAIVAQTAQAGAVEAGPTFAKVAQAVRYTLQLEARLAKGLGNDRGAIATQRAERRSQADDHHSNDREGVRRAGVACAVDGRHAEREAAEALMDDVEELLVSDDFEGYEQRPVGETIARLCRALGLDPDHCVKTRAGWMIKTVPPSLSGYAKPGPESPAANGVAGPRLAPRATGPPN